VKEGWKWFDEVKLYPKKKIRRKEYTAEGKGTRKRYNGNLLLMKKPVGEEGRRSGRRITFFGRGEGM